MEEANRITTLLLDIGGVLLTNGWDRESRKHAAEKFGLDYEDINERHHLTYDTYESGKLSLDEYLDRIVFYKPREFSRQEFRRFIFDRSRPHADMTGLVKSLKEKYRLKVAAISNEGREIAEYRIEKYRLREIFDFFMMSCFLHVRKPDADIYRMTLEVAQVRADECVYIDDREMFAKVAADIGISSIHHVSYDSTQKRLEKMNLAL